MNNTETFSFKINNIHKILKRLREQSELQLLVLIGLVPVIIFSYIPIYGLIIAFKNYSVKKGIWGSPWIGLDNINEFLSSPYFLNIMYNTFGINVLKLIFCFPIPVLFALLLNEIRIKKLKAIFQGVSYLPHILSWVICFGVFSSILARDDGMINSLLMGAGIIEQPIFFLGDKTYWWPVLIITENWKETGWSAIIYIAAISNIDVHMYEASMIDGASRFKKTVHITLPSIMPVIAVLFVLSAGNIMNGSFDQLFVMSNSLVADSSRTIDMFIYQTGLAGGRYDYAAAAGLFKGIIAFVLLLGANKFARHYELGIW